MVVPKKKKKKENSDACSVHVAKLIFQIQNLLTKEIAGFLGGRTYQHHDK